MATRHSVLRVNAVEEQEQYRKAVAEILRNVQCDAGVTLLDISEAIDVSLGTISNAANKKADLSSVFLLRIGKVFGSHFIDPFIRLTGGRIVPVEHPSDEDVLPIVTKVAFGIASSRTPTSPGGVHETLRQQMQNLPDVREALRLLSGYVSSVEERIKAA